MGTVNVWGEMVDTADDNAVAAVLSYTPHPKAVAGYVGPRARDNRYVTFPQLAHHFYGHARCLSIATHREYPAEFLDIENGDATPAELPEWLDEMDRRHGMHRPGWYTSESMVEECLARVREHGLHMRNHRIWVASWENTLSAARYHAVRLLHNPLYPAVQMYSTEHYDVSLLRRDFWK